MVLTFGDNARMAAESTREALTDALTGLGNRRRLMRDLEDGLADGSERTIALFDLDGFKNYNDVFGHPAGDALLVRLGARARARRGRQRRGLPPRRRRVLRPARRHRRARPSACSRRCVVALTDRGHGFDVGCSHGAAKLPSEADERAAALTLADRRLYSEKFERRRDAISEQTCDALLQVLHEREPDLRDHVGDVAELALRVGIRLGLKAEELDDVRRAAELHDVGKSAVPDAILAKPGPLDEREWEFVRQHTLVGERILRAAPALRQRRQARPLQPRALRRHRLPRRPRRPDDPARRPHRLRLRRVGRDDHHPPVPRGALHRRRAARAAPLQRHAVRPGGRAARCARRSTARAVPASQLACRP